MGFQYYVQVLLMNRGQSVTRLPVAKILVSDFLVLGTATAFVNKGSISPADQCLGRSLRADWLAWHSQQGNYTMPRPDTTLTQLARAMR